MRVSTGRPLFSCCRRVLFQNVVNSTMQLGVKTGDAKAEERGAAIKERTLGHLHVARKRKDCAKAISIQPLDNRSVSHEPPPLSLP
jgi:hypothetical protein